MTSDLLTRSAEQRDAPVRRPSGRAPRVSSGHVVALVAALVAGLLNFVVLRSGEEPVRALVTTAELVEGTPLSQAELSVTEVDLEQSVLDTLVLPEDLEGLAGWVAAAPIPAGELVPRSALRAPAGPDGSRAMSLAVPPSRAAGGAITTGDRVDVAEVIDGRSRWVLLDAPVLATSTNDVALAGGDIVLTVAVEGPRALRLAAAIDSGTVHVVRSTGATPLPFEAYRDEAGRAATPPSPDALGGSADGQ